MKTFRYSIKDYDNNDQIRVGLCNDYRQLIDIVRANFGNDFISTESDNTIWYTSKTINKIIQVSVVRGGV